MSHADSMKLRFLDYSKVYYEDLAGEQVPEQRGGKFVQITNGDVEHLIMSPYALSKYHANIVERFCLGKKLSGAFNEKRDHFEINEPDWEVQGGGIWSIDEEKKVLTLSGTSQAYGRFDSHGLKDKLQSNPELAGFNIEFDRS